MMVLVEGGSGDGGSDVDGSSGVVGGDDDGGRGVDGDNHDNGGDASKYKVLVNPTIHFFEQAVDWGRS